MNDPSTDRRTYIEYIESCFRNYPESLAYYEPLKEHLEAGTGRQYTTLQSVSLFQVASCHEKEHRFPRLYPFDRVEWSSEAQRPRIAVIEGFPSPESIGLLGAKYLIRPEFFIGNLRLTRSRVAPSHSYDLPTIPSLQANLIRIRFASAVRDLKDPIAQTSTQLSRQRSDLAKAFSRYDQGLTNNRRYGDTRFRRIYQHDSRTFSIEQAIFMTISQVGEQWTVIFLTDQGRSLAPNQGLPWSYNHSNNRPVGTIDLVPYNMPAVDASTRPTGTTPGSPKPGSPALHQSEEHNHDQFHPLRRIILSDEIDAELLKTDPFFLLASVLRTSLLSWCQLLNLIGEKVSQAQNQLELTYEELELDLIQLRYHMQIIHAANENLSESLKMVERGGCPEWPQARSDAAKARKKDIQEQLRIDYLHVMDRCSLMIRQCTSSSAVLVGFAQLTTAEKGSQQAAEIHSLTRLATVFIPLSFSASVFGMNVTETDPTVSIAWFFGLATVLVAVTFAVVFWASLKSLFRRISRSMEEKPRF